MKKIMLLSALLLVPHQFFGKAKKPAEPTSVQLSTGQFLALTLSPWAAAAVLAFVVKKYWECEKNSLLRMPAQFERVETENQLPSNGSVDDLGEPFIQKDPPQVLSLGLDKVSNAFLGDNAKTNPLPKQ